MDRIDYDVEERQMNDLIRSGWIEFVPRMTADEFRAELAGRMMRGVWPAKAGQATVELACEAEAATKLRA